MPMPFVHRRAAAVAAAATLLCSGALMAAPDLPALQAQVFAAERAFARSMAERKHDDFVRWLADDTLFFDGKTPLRGKVAVAQAWKSFYDGAAAPFSWEPDQVEVIGDGTLAHSTGLVRNPAGQAVARFNSVWRQEAPGVWRVVIDKGSPLSEAERKSA